jgi:hypothetical protein
MVNYKWVIKWLDCIPKEGTMLNVVTLVHWIRYAQQDEIEVSNYGAMKCLSPSETDFTAYPDLTYEQVCGWLENGLDVAALDLNLEQQITNIINPPIVSPPLPFVNP